MMRRLAVFSLLTAAAGFGFPNPDFYCEITTGATLPEATRGVERTYTLGLANCSTPMRLAQIATGALPPGMTLQVVNSVVTIAGTPTQAGVYAFAVRVFDAFYYRPSKSFVLRVNEPLQIDTPAAATGVNGQAYTDTIRARGGVRPYLFSVVEGSLPAGLTLNSTTGVISGTMPANGSQFRVRVTDSSTTPRTVEKPFTIATGGQLTPTTAPPVGSVGSAYSFDIDGTLGSNGFALVLGSLPGGLTMDANGLITGTPTTAGEYHFTVRQTSGLTSIWRSFRIFVNSAATITGTPRNAEQNFAYDHVFAVNGGVAPYTFSVSGGSLPFGITLDSGTGALLGQAPFNEGTGTSNFTITAVDASGRSYSQAFSITDVFAMGSSNDPPEVRARAGVAGTASPYGVSGGGGTRTYTQIGGPGDGLLTINPSTGAVSYNFPTRGYFTPVVLVADSLGGSAVHEYIGYNVLGPLTIAPNTELRNTTEGQQYNDAVNINEFEFGPYTYSVTSGSLPPGLTLNSTTGVISGITDEGIGGNRYTFTVTVTDTLGQTANRSFYIGVGTYYYISTTGLPAGTTGTAYNTQINDSGTEIESWSVLSGSLPPGLTLNSSNGVISGTPTTAGSYTFTINLYDPASESMESDAKRFTIHVAAPMSFTITPASPLEATVGVSTSPNFVITGGRAPFSVDIGESSMPDGLYLLQGATAGIRGVPKIATDETEFINVYDADNRSFEVPYRMIIREPVRITPATVATATRTVAYTQALTATGGTGSYSWTVTGGGLPTGLSLTSGGTITGTPSANGTFSVTIRATDSASRFAERTYSMVVTDPVVLTNSFPLPNGVTLNPYNTAMTTTGGAATKTFSISGGDLPPLLTIHPTTGVISNLPLLPGVYDFTVRTEDSAGRAATLAERITIINELVITPTTLPNGTQNSAYSQALAASPATGAVLWSVTAGTLPAGVTLNSTTGVLGGTPTNSGTFNFTVQAVDSVGATGTRAYSLLILAVLNITPTTLPDGTLGTPYSQGLTATPAAGSVLWSVTAGTLPAGLTLNSTTGVISGTPQTSAPYSFTVSAADSQGQQGSRVYSMNILESLSITTASLPDATVKEAYTTTLQSSSPTPANVTWSIISGTLPPGLALSSTTGVISGMPTTGGTYAFTVRAAPPLGLTATRQLSIVVVPELILTSTQVGGAAQGRPFAAALSATGGRTPYTWGLNGTTLPAGLTLNTATGVVSGTTNAPVGNYPQMVGVFDSRGRSTFKLLDLRVEEPPPPPLEISPGSLPNGRVGQAYSAGFGATGGTPGYTFTVAQGITPPGLRLAGSSLAGTPTQEGTYRFTVNVEDARGRVTGNSYVVVIEPALLPLTVTPSSIAPTATFGQPFTLQFGATGGKAPYTFAISGNTPPGTSANSSGMLSGTPSQGGTFTFTVEATDALQTKASRTYSVTVTGALTITTQPPLPDGGVGTPYSVAFGASGGRAPYSWSISGSTPPGLGFDGGTLSGTPTAQGTFGFTVTVRDSQQATASAGFSITITDKLEITNTPGDAPLVAGTGFSFAFATRGGRAPVTFSLAGGELPPGLTLSAAGAVTGTPTAAGTYSFSVLAKDAVGNQATGGGTLRVLGALTVTTASLPEGTIGQAYSAGVAASGGVAPLGTWSVSQGSLPAGLSMAPDGSISGTPTAAGASAFTVRITDAAGTVATKGLSIVIGLPPLPQVILSGLPQTLPPGTQNNVTIQLAAPFPAPVSGTLTIIFTPNAVNNSDDPAVQFSSGGRTVTFTIPAGQTAGVFPVTPLRIISGTVAGTIRIITTTNPQSATPVPETTLPIVRSAPVITGGTAQLGTGTFTLNIDGFSNTRELSSATFRLTPVAGATLTTTEVPVAVASAFTSWYQSSASAPFGGQFRLTMPFNVAGSLGDIESVTVTVTNSVGTSQPFTVRLR